MQRRTLWIKIKVGQAAVYAVVLAATMVAPAGLLAGTTCATPAGSVPCSQGPVRKHVALPAPAAAPSRAAAAKVRRQQVTAQRQQQVAVTKQRAGIRSGLNSKNPKSLSSRRAPTD